MSDREAMKSEQPMWCGYCGAENPKVWAERLLYAFAIGIFVGIAIGGAIWAT